MSKPIHAIARIALAAASMTLVACTVMQPAGSVILGENLTLGGGTYTSPGGLTLAVEMREIQGKTGVCGVWAESEKQSVMTRLVAPQVLASAGVAMGGEAVAHGLGFLAKVAPARSYAGQRGNCAVTDRPWSAADAGKPVQIVIPRQIVVNDLDSDGTGDGGILIWFRPGGPSAHPDDVMPWDERASTSN